MAFPSFLQKAETVTTFRSSFKIRLFQSRSFHVDHAAGLPYVMEKTNFREGKGKVYMTHATKAIFRLTMQDAVRIG